MFQKKHIRKGKKVAASQIFFFYFPKKQNPLMGLRFFYLNRIKIKHTLLQTRV